MIQLDKTIIPNIPFIWYREQELVCPIDYFRKINNDHIDQSQPLKREDRNNLKNENCEIQGADHIIIQRNISESNNLYICLHSLMYYELHKENPSELMIIPNNYAKNMAFEVKIIPVNDCEIKEISRGLKTNQFVSGNVYIHNSAFSPPGCLHFKVNNEREVNEFICIVRNEILGINMSIFFVLFNDLKGMNIDDKVNEMIKKLIV